MLFKSYRNITFIHSGEYRYNGATMHNNSDEIVLTLADSVKCKENPVPFGISLKVPSVGFKHKGR